MNIKQTTLAALVSGVILSGCASRDMQQPAEDDTLRQTQQPASATSGGRYAMSGDAYPLDPPDVSQVPDAEPREEPLSRAGNRASYEVWGKTYRVLPDSTGYAKEGTASWYGEKFHGYATSNGEIYDMYKMTAAHRSLPLPTYARVTSQENGNSVIVRINDRGPFHSEREIDLSYAAASRLGFTEAGTGRVKVEAIDPKRWRGEGVSDAPTPAATAEIAEPESASDDGPFYLQIAALGSAESADRLKEQLQRELRHGVRVTHEADVYRVQVGPVARQQQERPLRESLRQAGFPQAFIVR
ncbi:septal ring lytic transglycosylase RlpA family protein [Halomonas massiliensis]|uniref:septal ring lytic transglycosylase RlpA family protein n=1 Tax=Vreelandella massiliensis TaxID=1816686 RepID=UPI00096ABCEF